MNRQLLIIGSLIVAGSVSANPFSGNHDLYDGMEDSARLMTAVQPGIGDSYGGSVFEHTDLLGTRNGSSGVPRGGNDAYGSSIPNVEAGQLDW